MKSAEIQKPTRAERLREFRAKAEQLGLFEFRSEIVKFVQQKIPSDPTSPRKQEWGYSFGLDRGGPVYVNVSINWDQMRLECCVTFNESAMDAISEATIASLNDNFSDECFTYDSTVKCLKLSLPKEKWAEMKGPLSEVLEEMVQGADR